MNEVQSNEVQRLSFARVMQSIFARGDVEHKDLVKLRKRVEQLTRIQITKRNEEPLDPGVIAFAALSFIENGKTAREVCELPMASMLERARAAAVAWKGITGDAASDAAHDAGG